MLVVTAFFIAMNVLLWRSEFGGRQFGASLPAETVWEKVLTAPDSSYLTIRHHGKKIGTCHWSPTIGKDRRIFDELPPEGMVEEPSDYSIEVSGNVLVDEVNRVRFTLDLQLASNQAWEDLSIRVTLRPSVWELRATNADQSLRVYVDDGEQHIDKLFSFSDLRNPEKVLKEVGGPLLPATLAPLGLLPRSTPGTQPNMGVGLKWEAHYDRLRLGADWMRVYRLQARLLDRFQAVIFVSLVGEILKVELPDQLVLMNDALANLSAPEDDRTDSRR
jgi:hypothetical protein